MSLARIPEQYTTGPDSTKRSGKKACDVAMEWLAMLSASGNLLEQLTVMMISQNPEIANVCVASHMNAKHLTPASTAAIQDFAGFQ